MLFGQPKYALPELPDDITEISDEELMVLFSKFVAWQNYAASDFSTAEVQEARTEAMVRWVEAQHMVTNWTNAKDKVTLARAQMALSPEVMEARDQAAVAYAHRKLVGVVYENCERCANLVSRELSRRIGPSGPIRRARRWDP